MIITLVYKSGGDFDIRHVKSLVGQLRNQGEYKGEIHCLTDCVEDVSSLKAVKSVELKHNWPGWWSKIELFRPGLFEDTVLFMDLDTFILDDISELIKICIDNQSPVFLRGRHPRAQLNSWLASGMMTWKGNQLLDIYDSFIEVGPTKARKRQESHRYGAGQRGDQGFIRRVVGDDNDYFQDLVPTDKYILFKRDFVIENKSTQGCHVLCWSGRIRPHNNRNPFNEFWESYV